MKDQAQNVNLIIGMVAVMEMIDLFKCMSQNAMQ